MPDLALALAHLSLNNQREVARLMERDERNVRRWLVKGPPPDVVPFLRAVAVIHSLTGRAPAEIIKELRHDAGEKPD